MLVGNDVHRSGAFAITQLLILYHMLLTKARVALGSEEELEQSSPKAHADHSARTLTADQWRRSVQLITALPWIVTLKEMITRSSSPA